MAESLCAYEVKIALKGVPVEVVSDLARGMPRYPKFDIYVADQNALYMKLHMTLDHCIWRKSDHCRICL